MFGMEQKPFNTELIFGNARKLSYFWSMTGMQAVVSYNFLIGYSPVTVLYNIA